MSERKYSVSEIDRMRAAVKHLMMWTRVPWEQPPRGLMGAVTRFRPGRQEPPAKDIEERVRTYMLNGTDPDELEERVAAEEEWAEAHIVSHEPR